MDVHIENYKNIKSLDVSFQDNKINFVYGLSGSGKSSICETICQDTPDNVSFGKDKQSQKIIINPSVDKSNISLFNEESRYLFISEQDEEQIYKVMFSKDDSMEKIYDNLMSNLKEMASIRPLLMLWLSNINDLKRELKIRSNATKLNGKNNYITALEIEANSIDYKKNVNFVKTYGLDYLKWIITGTNFLYYKKDKCPFCTRVISKNRKERIENIVKLTPENYSAIVSSNAYTKVFNIEEPNYTSKRDLARVKNSIEKILECEIEIKKINNEFDSISTSKLNIENIKPIKLSKTLKEMIPELVSIVEKYNGEIKEIKNKARWYQRHSDKLIKKNSEQLNGYLHLLGIPYKFVVNQFDSGKKTAEVLLKHNDNSKNEDNRKSLSYGEVNIISLLLFILSSEKKYIIIDDPASSFDENRRSIFYNLMLSELKYKTCIVFSHSQSFVKNAVLSLIENKNDQRIGNLIYINNSDKMVSAEIIEIDDVDSIFNHVTNHIKEEKMPYFQTIINARVLAEKIHNNKEKEYSIIYGYLSAILHEKDKNEIETILHEKNINEAQILELIRTILKINVAPMPSDYKQDFDYNKLSMFEKVVYKREILNKKTGDYRKLKKYAKDVLSEIVHLNEQSFYTLNPYKFIIYPQNVIDIVNEV